MKSEFQMVIYSKILLTLNHKIIGPTHPILSIQFKQKPPKGENGGKKIGKNCPKKKTITVENFSFFLLKLANSFQLRGIYCSAENGS